MILDQYLSEEDKKRKADSATRVLGRIVKYREDEQAGKLSHQQIIAFDKFLKKELEANKDLSFDFFKRTKTLKDNIALAINDLNLYVRQKLCDYLIEHRHRPMVGDVGESVRIHLDPVRDGMTTRVDILPSQPLYILNCTEELADDLYRDFMPDEEKTKDFDSKAFLNTLIDGKWAKKGLTNEKRALLDNTLNEYKGFYKKVAFKAEEIMEKTYFAELTFQDFIHKNIARVFKESGNPAVFELINEKEVSFTIERQDDSIYDEKNGYSQKLEISEDGRIVWLDNVTEEIYEKILDAVTDRSLPDAYYNNLMADLDRELARIKAESGKEFKPSSAIDRD